MFHPTTNSSRPTLRSMHITPNPDPGVPPATPVPNDPLPGPAPVTDPPPIEVPEPIEVPPVTPPPIIDPPATNPMA